MIRRTTKICLEVIVGLVVGAVLVTGFTGWRLSEGPVSLSFLTPAIETSLSRTDGSFLIDVEETVLVWAGWERTLEVRAIGVRALGGERLLAEVPEMSVSFGLAALLSGSVQPRWVEVIAPLLTVVRKPDGGVDFGLGGGSMSDQVRDPEELMAEWLQGGPDSDDPPASLRRISIVDADLVIDDKVLDRTWIASNVSLRVARQDRRIGGWIEGNLDIGTDDPLEARATFDYEARDRVVNVTTDILAPDPTALAPLLPGLPLLAGAAVPVQIRCNARLTAAGMVEAARVSMATDRGRLDLAAVGLPAVLDIDALTGSATLRSPQPVETFAAPTLDQWSLSADAAVALSTADADPVNLSASLRADSAGRPLIDLELTDLNVQSVVADHPWIVERYLPDAAGLVLAMPTDAQARVRLNQDFKPVLLTGTVTARAGTVTVPGLSGAARAVDAFRAVFSYAPDDGSADLASLSLEVAGGTIEAAGRIAPRQADGRQVLAIEAAIANFPIDTLSDVWPAGSSPNAKRWVATNIEGGRVVSATVSIDGTVSPDGVDVVDLDGKMSLAGATVHYARPLKPISGVATDVVFDLDTFKFTFTAGTIDRVRVRGGTLNITDILAGNETADIDVTAGGPLRDILAILNHPTLGYASRFGIVPADAKGSAETELRFDFPLISTLTFDGIAVGVDARLTDVTLPRMVGAQSLRDGQLSLKLDNHGMQLTGPAIIGNAPMTLDVLENFDGPHKDAPYRGLYKVRGIIDAADLRHYGLDATAWVRGPLGMDLVYRVVSDTDATIDIGFNIVQATASLPYGLWKKPAGVGGHVGVRLLFPGRALTEIPRLVIESDGLAVLGAIDFNPAGELAVVRASRLAVGRTELGLSSVEFLDGHLDISLSGRSLDLGPILAKDSDARPSQGLLADFDPEPVLPWTLAAQAQLGQVFLQPDAPAIGNMQLEVGHDGTLWRYMTLHGDTGGGKTVRLLHDLDAYLAGNKQYLAAVQVEDLGALLRALGATASIVDGDAALYAGYEAKNRRRNFVGKLVVRDYGVRDAPFITHLLNVASLNGIVGFLSRRDGLRLDGFETDFQFGNKVLALTKARAWNTGIGVTAQGNIDFANHRLDMDGTIAPVYGLSQAIGWVPLLGDLLTPNGEGVLAAQFGLAGDVSDPSVSVNPLSIVTPGFLRSFFDIFEDAERTVPGPQPAQAPEN